MVTEYRIQRKDRPWGQGQGYYIIAGSAEAAKRVVKKQLHLSSTKFLIAKPWKTGSTTMNLKPVSRSRRGFS